MIPTTPGDPHRLAEVKVRRLTLASALILSVAALLIASPVPVNAHALLVRSNPAEGARLLVPPSRITAWFSEPLDQGVSTLRVLNGSGEPVDAGRMEFDPSDSTKVSVALQDSLAPGFYSVTWQTLSRVDGHIWFGRFEFTVLNPDGSAPTGPRLVSESGEPAPSTATAESVSTKAAGLAAGVALIGSLIFVLFVAGPASRTLAGETGVRVRDAVAVQFTWLALPALALLAIVAGAELLLQGRQLGAASDIGAVLRTSWGTRWLQRQVVLALLAGAIALFLWLRHRRARWPAAALLVALPVGLVYLLLVSAVSHAGAVLAGSFWATAADFIHLTTAAAWVGGLVHLALLLAWSRREVPDESRPPMLALALQRFSLLAAISVVALFATGAFNAFVHVSTLGAMLDTAYGRALTAKLVLTVLLLAVAALNAFILRPRLVRAATMGDGVSRLRRRLFRLVVMEAALGLLVLMIVGVLVQYPTARSVTETAAARSQASAPPTDQPAGATAEDAVPGGRGRFAYPLAAGNWGVVVGLGMGVAGALIWVWSRHQPDAERRAREALGATTAIGLSVTGLVVLVLALNAGAAREGAAPRGASEATAPPAASPSTAVQATRPPPQAAPFKAVVALRYQTEAGRFVLLEAAPFQVGDNTFHVTVMDQATRPIDETQAVSLRFSRLEREGIAGEVAALRPAEARYYVAEYALAEAGWWSIEVMINGRSVVTYYLRLDAPSRAPLAFDPPDYQSDPTAEALFRQTVARYEGLESARWREELTSGLLAPTGIGAWVVSTGEAVAPDRVHIRVLSPGFSDYELYRIGGRSCTQPQGKPWECTAGQGERAFDLDYQQPATAFRLGRQEPVDGERSRVLLFYNPRQGAWYAWWVGEGTGHLRRQAMVAPGHFMLLHFFDHNVPISIELPPQAR